MESRARDRARRLHDWEKITDDYEERNRRFWDDILHGEKILSDKEADEMESFVKKLRKEKGFR